jgi:hypothetical protein
VLETFFLPREQACANAKATAVQAKESLPIVEVVTLKLKSGVTAAQFESADREIQNRHAWSDSSVSKGFRGRGSRA